MGKRRSRSLSLFQALTLFESLIPKRATRKIPKGIPLVYSCPSVPQDTLTKRTCTKCSLYLASIKSKTEHTESCDDDGVRATTSSETIASREVRPVRIGARRGRELTYVMEMQGSVWHDMEFNVT